MCPHFIDEKVEMQRACMSYLLTVREYKEWGLATQDTDPKAWAPRSLSAWEKTSGHAKG